MKKKILVWLSTDLTEFCISYYLQNNADYELYAIIDAPKNVEKFFVNQKIVKFEKTWIFHEYIKKEYKYDLNYLELIEKKYDIKLWKYCINERVFYRFFNFHKFSKTEILSITEQSLKLFEYILETINPDYFISKIPGLYHLEIFRKICEKNNIPILIPFNPKLGSRVMISKNTTSLNTNQKIDDLERMKKNFHDFQSFMNISKNKTDVEKYVKNLNGSHIGMLKAAIKFLFSKNSSEKFLYTYYGRTKFNVLKFMLSSFFQTYFRKRFINNNLEKNPKINSPFIYFPLGVDLEKNLLIDSPLYNNQIEIIRIIAKSIPINYELWIKESPGQMTRNWRSISDYKKIINLPNVRVFHPDCSNSELIQGSSLVITIAGSSGMEAAIYQKPAIVFSDTLYSHLSCVTRIREIENLSEEIKIALKKSVDVNEINKFLQTIEKNSVSFDLMKFYTSHTDTFFLNGSILDNHIDELKMSNYLKSNYQVIKNLGDEYLKQISLLSKNHC